MLGNQVEELYKIEVSKLICKHSFEFVKHTLINSNFEMNINIALVLERIFCLRVIHKILGLKNY